MPPKLYLLSLAGLLASTLAFSQTAVVQRNVNLRSDPSTHVAPITLLTPPTTLTLWTLIPSKATTMSKRQVASRAGFGARTLW